MKKYMKFPSLCASLAVFCLLGSSAAYAVQDCEFNGQSINTNNGAATAGKTGMVLCKDRDSGRPEREYELRDGKSIGLSRYFRDGKLQKEFTITANGPHEGLEREWAANGQLINEFTNVNGNARGLRRQWFDDGKLRKVDWIADSQSDGAAVEYHAGGLLASLRCGPKPLLAPTVDDAKLCGFGAVSTTNLYSYKGELRKTVVMLAGVEQKATSFYGPNQPELVEELKGTQKSETFYAQDGSKSREKLWDVSSRPALLLREAEFHASGTLVRERIYAVVETNGRKRSRLTNESRFYLNGQPQSKEVYTLDGTTELRDTQRFTDQGKLRQQGRYALDGRYNERAVGVHQTWFANGKLAEEDTYDSKGNVARQKVWDESGAVVSDEELFEDGSRKAFSK